MRHLKLVHSTELEPAVRIAFASSDRKRVDQHFGAAGSFAIYEVGPDDSHLAEVAEFNSDPAMPGSLSPENHEDRLAGKIALLEGCAAVYCCAVGTSAIGRLLAAGIQPVKVSEGTAIDELVHGLGRGLADGPPVWLAKHLKSSDAGRFDAMDEEGWQE